MSLYTYIYNQLKDGEDNQILEEWLKGSQNKTTMDSDVSDLLKTLPQAKKTTNINKKYLKTIWFYYLALSN